MPTGRKPSSGGLAQTEVLPDPQVACFGSLISAALHASSVHVNVPALHSCGGGGGGGSGGGGVRRRRRRLSLRRSGTYVFVVAVALSWHVNCVVLSVLVAYPGEQRAVHDAACIAHPFGSSPHVPPTPNEGTQRPPVQLLRTMWSTSHDVWTSHLGGATWAPQLATAAANSRTLSLDASAPIVIRCRRRKDLWSLRAAHRQAKV